MNMQKNTIINYLALAIAAFLFLLFFSYATSPIFSNNYGISDSAIFLLVGKGITSGHILYLDLFDHKGPVLFFLEALGWLIIPDRFGSFFMQWIFMVADLILIVKMGQLFLNKKQAWLPILFFFLILASTFEGGNLTEELSLPFLLLPLYLVLRHLKKEPIKKAHHNPLYAFIYGICFTLIVFMRLNNAVLIGAIVLVVMIQLFTNKAYVDFFHNVLGFIAGALITFAAIASYFIINHAFGDMIYATFLFNMKYAEGISGIFSPESLVKFAYSVSPVVFSGCMGIYYLLKKEDKYIGLLLTIGSLVTFFSLLLGGIFYHYFTLTTPCFVLAIILLIELYVKNEKKLWQGSHRGLLVAVLVLFMTSCVIYLCFCFSTIVTIATEEPDTDYYENALTIKSSIPEEDRDSVFGYEIPAGWFLMADITPCYKYFTLQEWWGLYDPQVIVEMNNMLKNNPPKWIVMTNDQETNAEIYDVLGTNYELVTKDEEVSLYHRIAE
ncbi:hypothetical protein [Acetobacterium tundrae]|uniref:Glycosyltransferase RgtA/B/C/D-like domain-containing protein n=1 Tax=Acetobacterium tundrae TaxID=132932 RepID=A0ABR6WN69_9FIRM|nr:hypothetical protein [Acetobacterium tundrae]MBC3797794.1 hypothetical protein [Acetobacterium tundrae]